MLAGPATDDFIQAPHVYFDQGTEQLGLALFTTPNTNAIMSSVQPRHYGVGSATLGTMRLVGQVGSMSFAMMVFSLYLGAVEITPQFHPQFLAAVKMAFAVLPTGIL